MKSLIFTLTFVAATVAVPQGYSLPSPSTSSIDMGSCGKGQVRNADGKCVKIQVRSRVFIFDIPHIPAAPSKPRIPPKPKVERNIIFVRIPEGGQGPQPVVVPPPRQEHVVYVLNKQSTKGSQKIEVPATSSEPEVYLVTYKEGENPTLPFGGDLQTALSSASQGSGRVLGGGKGGGGRGGGFGRGRGRGGGGGGRGGFGNGSRGKKGGGSGSSSAGGSSPSTAYETP